MPTAVTHQVEIKAVGGAAVATPMELKNMDAGETAQFTTTGKAFRVVFTPWPFSEPEHEITTDELLTFSTPGDFKFACYVTVELPYKEGSGGTGNVRPPTKP